MLVPKINISTCTLIAMSKYSVLNALLKFQQFYDFSCLFISLGGQLGNVEILFLFFLCFEII